MSPKVDLYNLGSRGVDLTKSKVHADDGSLRSAQNAVPDYRGEAGGLGKRDGLTAINSSTAGGSVQGVVLSSLSSGTSNIAIYAGVLDGWSVSSDGFATKTYSTFGGGPEDIVNNNIYPTSNGAPSGPAATAATINNKIYYATDGTTNPTIAVLDGTFARVFAEIPQNPDVGAASSSILHLFGNEGVLYATSHDVGSSSADLKGSVYSVNVATGVFTKLGATFPTGYLPFCLTWFMGRLWAGTYSDDETFSGRVYWIRPGIDTSWTLDHTTTAGQGQIMSLKAYKGNLYAATTGKSTAAGLVLKRTPLAVWSTSETGTETASGNGYYSLEVFGDNLFASYSGGGTSPTVARIRKFDNSSWSTVLTPTNKYPHRMFATPQYLLAAQYGPFADSFVDVVYVSSDGTSFTERDLNSTTSLGYPWAIGVISS